MRRLVTASAAAMAVVLALTGCRAASDDNGEETPGTDGGVVIGAGVTEDPCPDAVNEDNGCIYLGILTDLTGPFAGFGGPLTAAQEGFWQRVNEDGGVQADGVDQAFDVDVTTYRRDSGYDPTEHSRLYDEMKPNILALAQTLGSATTAAIYEDMDDSDIIAAPAAFNSVFNFQDLIVESMANYCVEAMNGVDYAVETYGVESVMAVGFNNDFGEDAAGGVALAAEANGLEFAHVPTPTGAGEQAEAVGRILAADPDLVIVTTGPTELAAIVGGAAANGYTGRFIGSNPTWNPALLASDAGPALEALFEVSAPLENWDTDTPGHAAMRDQLGEVEALSDGYTAGWIWQYPIKAALEGALANGDLTRSGVRAAAAALTEVDYEGMLPEGGNYVGGPEAQSRYTVIGAPEPGTPIGITTVQDWFVGPTAEAWEPQNCRDVLS